MLFRDSLRNLLKTDGVCGFLQGTSHAGLDRINCVEADGKESTGFVTVHGWEVGGE